MARLSPRPRGVRSLLLIAASGGVLVMSAGVAAQSGRQVMVLDDGSGPRYVHFSLPDFRGLREPDFVRRDLPSFREKLQLDAARLVVVETLLDDYLEAFRALAQKSLPEPPKEALRIGFEGIDGGEGGQGMADSLGEIVREAIEGARRMGGVEAGEGPMSVRVFVRAGADGGVDEDVDVTPAEADGDPEAEVVISVSGPEGVELPEELRKELEERARQMVEELKERMEEGHAEDPDWMHPDLGVAERIEERRAHFEELAARTQSFKAAKASLRQRFVDDVQAQLSAEQLERWPALERTLTRHKTLPKGRLDGERTDLLAILDRLDLTDADAEAVAEEAEAYELLLHEALTRRNAYLVDANAKVDRALGEDKPDRALSIVDRAARLRVAVRNANGQFTQRITARLSDEAARSFRDRVRRASYPRVYRPTPAQRAFEAVDGLDGLDPEAWLNIVDLETAYRSELDNLNEQIRRVIDKHQPREPRRSIERLVSMTDRAEMFFDADDDPIREAFGKRAKLDESYVKRLHDLLTPEQVAKLPKLPSRERRQPMVIRRLN